MQRDNDTIGSRRLWFGLIGVSTLAILAGCGGNAPVPTAKARPGADAQVPASASLPAASSGRQYDSGFAPLDETRGGTQIGSVVPAKGGQKAQKEAVEKEAAERDAKSREQRQARTAAEMLAAGALAGAALLPSS